MLEILSLFTGVFNEGFNEVVPKGAAGNQAQCGVFYDDERGRIKRLTRAEGHEISYNPETQERNLIGQEAPEEFIKSYRISFGKDIVIEKGDPNYEFFSHYRRMRPTGSNAKLRVYISDFRLEEIGANHNKYYCEAFDVTCTVDSANETDAKLVVNFSQAGSLEYGIIERTDDGGEITYGFTPSKDIAITKINVTDKADTDGVEVGIGKTQTIAVEFSPLGSGQEFTVESEDEEIVKVEKLRNSIIIKGCAAGAAAVTVTSTANTNMKIAITVSVVNSSQNVPVTGITLNKSTLVLSVDETETLIATVSPPNATNKTVVWASDDEDIAIVIDGEITAIDTGIATITAAVGGFSADCVVTVS